MFDPNIPRWVKASVATYLENFFANPPAGIPTIKLYLNAYSGKDIAWAELRIDGPESEQYERASWQLDFDVDILITAFTSGDFYLIDKLIGLVATALDSDICCFKYGNGPVDDQSQFGVLQQYPSTKNKVKVTNFGKITADSQQTRSSIAASYSMWID